MPESQSQSPLWLGVDIGTQSLKIVAVEQEQQQAGEAGGRVRVAGSFAVSFDTELPAFGTRGGAIRHDAHRVTAPPAMWATV